MDGNSTYILICVFFVCSCFVCTLFYPIPFVILSVQSMYCFKIVLCTVIGVAASHFTAILCLLEMCNMTNKPLKSSHLVHTKLDFSATLSNCLVKAWHLACKPTTCDLMTCVSEQWKFVNKSALKQHANSGFSSIMTHQLEPFQSWPQISLHTFTPQPVKLLFQKWAETTAQWWLMTREEWCK